MKDKRGIKSSFFILKFRFFRLMIWLFSSLKKNLFLISHLEREREKEIIYRGKESKNMQLYANFKAFIFYFSRTKLPISVFFLNAWLFNIISIKISDWFVHFIFYFFWWENSFASSLYPFLKKRSTFSLDFLVIYKVFGGENKK